MIPVDRLHQHLGTTARDLEHMGARTTQRFSDWQRIDRIARDSLRGGGSGEERSEERLADQRLDRQAGGYMDEWATLIDRVDADLARLRVLMRMAHPDAPRSLRTSEMTNSQLVMDGWCPSCYRDHRYLENIAEGRYRDRCRRCGEHRAATGADPTMEELKTMHARGKSLRLRVTAS